MMRRKNVGQICLSDGQSSADPILHMVDPAQTKVRIYGDQVFLKKFHARNQAKDRKKQLARLQQANNMDFVPPSVIKQEPEFVSNADIMM